MRRIHFITCSFIEDNNTRQPNDDIVVAVALNSSSAHYFVGSVSLSALSLFGTFHSFSIRYVCVCVVAPHSFSLSCFFVNAVSQLCVNISIQKKTVYHLEPRALTLSHRMSCCRLVERLVVRFVACFIKCEQKYNENFTNIHSHSTHKHTHTAPLFINSCTIAV